MFTVPPEFNRNAASVQGRAPAADTGVALLAYMCDRLGLPDLGATDLLDFGCGTRFTDSIMNRDVKIKSYTGIDVYKPMVDFLRENAVDERLSFHHIDARNPLYNPEGEALTPLTELPVGDRKFDVACMFSVITHQLPADTASIFSILRRYSRTGGSLFFSVRLEEGDFGYKEFFPDNPTGLSTYSPDLIRELLAQAGWRIESIAPAYDQGMLIFDSILCTTA